MNTLTRREWVLTPDYRRFDELLNTYSLCNLSASDRAELIILLTKYGHLLSTRERTRASTFFDFSQDSDGIKVEDYCMRKPPQRETEQSVRPTFQDNNSTLQPLVPGRPLSRCFSVADLMNKCKMHSSR